MVVHAPVACSVAVGLHEKQVLQRQQLPQLRRTRFEGPGLLQIGLCVQHVCIPSLWQDRLSSGALPPLGSLLSSQPCKSRFTNAFTAKVKAKLMATREERDKSHKKKGGGRGLHQEKVESYKYDLGLLPHMVKPVYFYSPAHNLPVLFSLLTLQSATFWPDIISWPVEIWRKHVTAEKTSLFI